VSIHSQLGNSLYFFIYLIFIKKYKISASIFWYNDLSHIVILCLYQNIFTKNLSPQGSAVYLQGVNALSYMFHNLFIKNIAATIPQSSLSNFSIYNKNGLGTGIVVSHSFDIITFNETFFDNIASSLGIFFKDFKNISLFI